MAVAPNGQWVVGGNVRGIGSALLTTISSLDADASEVDLLLKAQDSTPCNLLEVWYQPAQNTVQVWTCHNWGTWTQHGADIPLTLAAGDQFGARANADGSVTVYKNGTAVGSVTLDTSWPYTANGGRVGVWLIDAPGTVLDDVGAGRSPDDPMRIKLVIIARIGHPGAGRHAGRPLRRAAEGPTGVSAHGVPSIPTHTSMRKEA